jgi:hypothetical protein
MSRHQTAGQSRYIEVVNKSFRNVAEVQTCVNDVNKSEFHSRRN